MTALYNGNHTEWEVIRKDKNSIVILIERTDDLGNVLETSTSHVDETMAFDDGHFSVNELKVRHVPETDPDFVGYISWDEEANTPTAFELTSTYSASYRSHIWPNKFEAIENNKAKKKGARAVFLKEEYSTEEVEPRAWVKVAEPVTPPKRGGSR